MCTPSLARETVNYAVQCLHYGERTLALDAIREEGCGLSAEEQQKMEQIIKDHGEHALGTKELNLAEDRMIGVLQPEAWAFMQNEVLVAMVLSYIDPYWDHWETYQERSEIQDVALGIVQTSHGRMHQRLIRESLSELQTMRISMLNAYITSGLPLCDLENLVRPLNWEEVFACCPELTDFQFDELFREIDEGEEYNNVAQAIQKSCPRFSRFVFNADEEEVSINDLLGPFKNRITSLTWAPRAASRCAREHLNKFLELPHLTHLFIKGSPTKDLVSKPEIFKEFKRLHTFSLTQRYISDTLFQPISTLPLKHLELISTMELNSAKLTLLAQMTHLEVLKLPKAKVTYVDLRQFVNSKKSTLKQILLSPNYRVWPNPHIKLEDILRLQAEFPTIKFFDRPGKEYKPIETSEGKGGKR